MNCSIGDLQYKLGKFYMDGYVHTIMP